jgi:hypothetical protein
MNGAGRDAKLTTHRENLTTLKATGCSGDVDTSLPMDKLSEERD